MSSASEAALGAALRSRCIFGPRIFTTAMPACRCPHPCKPLTRRSQSWTGLPAVSRCCSRPSLPRGRRRAAWCCWGRQSRSRSWRRCSLQRPRACCSGGGRAVEGDGGSGIAWGEQVGNRWRAAQASSCPPDHCPRPPPGGAAHNGRATHGNRGTVMVGRGAPVDWLWRTPSAFTAVAFTE